MLNFCGFIQVCVFTTNHHLKYTTNQQFCHSILYGPRAYNPGPRAYNPEVFSSSPVKFVV